MTPAPEEALEEPTLKQWEDVKPQKPATLYESGLMGAGDALAERLRVVLKDCDGLEHQRDYWEQRYETQHRTVHRMEDTVAALRGDLRRAQEALRDSLWSEAMKNLDTERFADGINSLVLTECQAIARLLDWIGVASLTPLSERVRLLTVEFATRTQQLSASEADELSRSALSSTGPTT